MRGEKTTLCRRMDFLVRDLDVGGAQRQLVLLAGRLHERGHDVRVVTFYDRHQTLRAELEEAGVPVRPIGKRGSVDPGFLGRLFAALKEREPDVLLCYLPGAQVVGTLAAVPLRSRVVWCVRSSALRFRDYGPALVLGTVLARLLASRADLVIANSATGARDHVSRGYPADRLAVVRNGVDLERFRSDPRAGRRVRREWGVPSDAPLVGLVARLDPMKGHSVFLRAAEHLARQRRDARFVIVGDGPEGRRSALHAEAESLGLSGRLTWAGYRPDIEAVHNALDIASSVSLYGEGCSNALAEALACGVPCVGTDVGDAAWLIGDCGRVVPPGHPNALAEAWFSLLEELGPVMSRRCREAAESRVPPGPMLEATEHLLADMLT